MLAPVRRVEISSRESGCLHPVVVRRCRTADGEADAVRQQGSPAAAQPLERLSRDPTAITEAAVPEGLRLDLDDVDEVFDAIPQLVERTEGDDADAEVEP